MHNICFIYTCNSVYLQVQGEQETRRQRWLELQQPVVYHTEHIYLLDSPELPGILLD